MTTVVKSAIQADLIRAERPTAPTLLWGSDMGYCPLRAILRVHATPTSLNFEIPALEYMQAGNMWEDETVRALTKVYGADSVITQLPLKTDTWSSKCDAVLWHKTPDVTIVEHKATGDKWWNYKGGLPKAEHLGQLWLYGELYEAEFGLKPRLILFYRSWGHYAEYTVDSLSDGLMLDGEIDGKPDMRKVAYKPWEWRAELEKHFQNGTFPEKTKHVDGNCTFQNKPNCRYYFTCYQ